MAEPTWEDTKLLSGHAPPPAVSGSAPTWDNTESVDEKYGGISGALKAGAAGLLRGATVGLSDPFLVKTGLVNKNTLRGLEEAQPEASIGSELVGTVAPAFFGDEAGVANIPGLISKVGGGVERAAAGALPEAASTLGRMATGAVTKGIGLGAEGAAYGLGQSISENALGDHDLVSEKTLANIGMSAALTGAFGSLIGTGLGALGKDLSSAEQKLAAEHAASELGPLGGTQLPATEKLSFMQALGKQKSNAKQIVEAGDLIGAPVLPGQTSASKYIQDATSAMSKSPTIPGVQTQQAISQGYDAVENIVKESLGAAEHLSPYDAGALIKEQVQNTVDKIYEPISKAYAERAALGQTIDLPDKARLKLFDKMVELGQGFGSRGSEGGKLIEQYAERALAQDTIGHLDQLIKEVNTKQRQAFKTLDTEVGHALGLVKDTLTDFQIGQIAKQGKALGKSGVPEAEKLAAEAINQHQEVTRQYKEFKEILNGLASDQRLGRKATTHGGVENVLDSLSNEKVVDKMFDPKNADGLARLQKNFPDVFKTLIEQKKSQILQASMKDGTVEVNKVLRQLYDEKKLSSKVRDMMFSPESLKKMNASKVWVESLPKDINPSGTSKAEAFKELLTNPVKASVNNFTSYATKKLIERFASSPQEAAKAMTLVNTERAAIKTAERISEGVSSIFKQSKSALPAKIFSKIASPQDYKEKTKEIKEMANNMLEFSDKVAKNTEDMFQHAPGVAQSLQGGMIRGVQFLNNKIPPSPVGIFEKEMDPSASEVAHFKRYYDLVQDPVSALNQVKDATLTNETIETLNAVYPKLYNEMKTELIDHVSGIKDPGSVPFQTRQSVSMFLGQPLDQSLSPAAIQANQAAFIQPNQEHQQGQQIQRPSKSGMGKITLGQRSKLNRGEMEA